jgi:soluble lytic murein transglycosylase-like protein
VQASARTGRYSAGLCRALAFLIGGLVAPFAALADVYASSAEDGSFRYATQPLDSSYRILLREPAASGAATGTRASSALRSTAQMRYQPLIERFARQYGVPADLVEAVAAIESGNDASAVSPRGARGVMQLLPSTARQYGLADAQALSSPERNIEAGVRHLKSLLVQHHGNVSLALAAYNAGAGAVSRNGDRIPPYRETMLYVPAVLAKAAAARSAR